MSTKFVSLMDDFLAKNSAAKAIFPDLVPVKVGDRDRVLRDSSSGVYVLNNNYTILDDEEEKTTLVLNVGDKSGQTDIIAIPATWVPINVLDLGSKEAILNSSSFRLAINRGRLILINAKDALNILEHEEAMLSYEIALRSLAVEQKKLDDDGKDANKKTKTERSTPMEEDEIEFSKCNPKVMDLCSRDGLTERDVQAFLFTQKGTLKQVDLKYLNQYLPTNIKNNNAVATLLTSINNELNLTS